MQTQYVSESLLLSLNEETGWVVRNKEETLKKFLPRCAYFFYKWKDIINFYKLPVYKEVDQNIKKYIHGIKVTPYKFRIKNDIYHHYVGMIDKRDIKKLERSPAHGSRFHMKVIRKNKKILDSIKFKDVRGDHVFFKSSNELEIPIWISVGLHGILEPREEIAVILGTIYSWKHYEWTLKYLQTKKKDLYANILVFIPIIGEIISSLMELYFSFKYAWLNRVLERKAMVFADKCGYGRDYLNFVKKMNYAIRLQAGSLTLIMSTIRSIYSRVADFMIRIFPFLAYASTTDTLRKRIEMLNGLEKNKKEIEKFFEQIDIELSNSLNRYLENENS